MTLIIEIKACYTNLPRARRLLRSENAKFSGTDLQTDTYFKVKNGRLKLREGNIENNLIFYRRKNSKSPKQSKVLLMKTSPESELKKILSEAIGILTIVKKKREIYWIGNVKIHLDSVPGLGIFIEIEAMDINNKYELKTLRSQCSYYMKLFGIGQKDLVPHSYSDFR